MHVYSTIALIVFGLLATGSISDSDSTSSSRPTSSSQTTSSSQFGSILQAGLMSEEFVKQYYGVMSEFPAGKQTTIYMGVGLYSSTGVVDRLTSNNLVDRQNYSCKLKYVGEGKYECLFLQIGTTIYRDTN